MLAYISKGKICWSILLIIAVILFTRPTEYYYFSSGTAIDLSDQVEVNNEISNNIGQNQNSFHIVAVAVNSARVYHHVLGLANPEWEIKPLPIRTFKKQQDMLDDHLYKLYDKGVKNAKLNALSFIYPQTVDLGHRAMGNININSIVEEKKNLITVNRQGRGNSGSLMYALEFINRLSRSDLTSGYKVSGSGRLHLQGHVTAVNGIKQKVIAAEKKGIDAFLAPVNNYESAIKYADSMKVIKVDSIGDAIKALEELN